MAKKQTRMTHKGRKTTPKKPTIKRQDDSSIKDKKSYKGNMPVVNPATLNYFKEKPRNF